MILHVCSDPDFLQIMVILKQVINIIKIGAPIVLIVIIMIDIIKSVTSSNYDGISKGTKQIPKRLLAAAMIFLVPTILEFMLNVIDESVDYATCITNAEPATIEQLYVDRADTYVVKAEKTLNETDLSSAKSVVYNLKDETLKKSYNDRLEKVAKAIANKKKSEYQEHESNNNYNNSPGNVNNNGTFPYYNQCDNRWKNISLTSGSYNTCGCGCGYASLSMVIAGLNSDTTITPKTVVPYVITFSGSKCAISDDALYSSNLKSRYGLSGTVVFGRSSSLSASQKKDKIVTALKQKTPIILLIPGHYIVLASISGNNITVLDPGNTSNNGTYTIDSLYNKYYNHKNRCNEEGICGFIMAISYSK